MKYSYKLRINKQRKRSDQTSALFFQVIINRKKTTVPLSLYWPADKFDFERSAILPRQRNDKQHEDYSRLIDRKAKEINEVFIWSRLAKTDLTVEVFQRELANEKSRADFIAFWDQEIDQRLVKAQILGTTGDSHRSSLNTLRQFQERIPFSELTKKFLEEYKAWLYRQPDINSTNTVFKKLKEVRRYVNLAVDAGYYFDNPFKGFKMPPTSSRLDYLSEEEFLRLKKYYYSSDFDPGHQITCRAFLFAC